ncbi:MULTISPECIES: hypothetical protein [unclassified Granulicatella]|uniref:hypothetical protein n=1 Tax=unclassified Granulicatella TaxID=2630493 RepID=UPI001073FC97|nr:MULTISPECIES: hypothetical protein [unclassified Granulicatella]MBF0780211.1 hypothetical protein [Granulicatella sp. 19428wC4_WM01]TFU95704.1 hypothetical protein E4T68_03785 [Granulicatella sp. WM01]
MSDIHTFTQQILNRKEQECQKHKQQAEQHQKERLALALDEINQNEQLMCQKVAKDIHLQETITIQQLTNHKRNVVLQHKQDKLHALFDKAALRMKHWTKDEFSQFLYKVLHQLNNQKQYTLHLGEYTSFPLQETDLSLETILMQQTQSPQITLPNYVKIGKDMIANEAGFILEENGVRYNYLFNALIKEVKQDYISALLQQLTE